MTQSHRVEYRDLDEVAAAVRNPKAHNIEGIRASIGRFGYVAPSVVDERTGRLVAGHGRIDALRAMRDTGETPPAGVKLVKGKWQVPVLAGWSSRSDSEAEAYLLADNQWTVSAGWNDTELGELLSELADADPELVGLTGFTDSDIAALLEGGGGSSEGEGGEVVSGGPSSDGSLLAIADVTIAEPSHQVTMGEVWELGGRHHLVVADVLSGWPTWSVFLDHEDALFVPYPGPYAPLSLRADKHHLVMVQPDPYIAGHILDKFTAMRGLDAVSKKAEA